MRADFRKRLVEVIMHRDENDDSDEEPAHPGAPLTTKEKDLLRCVAFPDPMHDRRFFITCSWPNMICTGNATYY